MEEHGDPDTELKDEITNKTEKFGRYFLSNITRTTCMDKNPFIDNLSEYIGNYIPQFECIFKYHLLLETLSAILLGGTVSLFPSDKKEKTFTYTQKNLILFLSGILKTPGMYNKEAELSKIYDESFSISNNQDTSNGNTALESIPEEDEEEEDEGSFDGGGGNGDEEEEEEDEIKDDVETKCYITTKRITRVKEMFTTDNVSNVTVQRDIGNIINGEITKISKKVLSEKWFDGELLKPVHNKSQVKLLKKEKDNLLNNHIYKSKPNSDLYSKTLTLNILQNTKLYLIKTAKLIVDKAKQSTNKDILVVLLLTLLQDSTIVGFIKTIQRSKKYTKSYDGFISDAKASKTYIGVDKIIVKWLNAIYTAIKNNPTIKSSGWVDLEYTYNYMKRLNLRFQKISGGNAIIRGGLYPEQEKVDLEQETVATTNTEDSTMNPNNEETKQRVTNYVDSITLFVKEQVDKYDVYRYVKSDRITSNENAAELRGSILVCILKTFKRKAFGMFLSKLQNKPEPDSDSSKKTTSNKTKQNPAQDDKYANDKIYKLFLQKLTTDLTGPESQLEPDVIETYRNIIKDISNTLNHESELSFSPMVAADQRIRNTLESGKYATGGNSRIKKKTKKARAETRQRVRTHKRSKIDAPSSIQCSHRSNEFVGHNNPLRIRWQPLGCAAGYSSNTSATLMATLRRSHNTRKKRRVYRQ